ncbi:MAG: Rieske (2Fe-2S) protein [Spongiibacteraceae bacterium]
MKNKGSAPPAISWQAIALSTEVVKDHPIARRNLNNEYVLFRNNNNEICTLENRCAHRRAPLSLGRITPQGAIQCPYHGWTYEGRNGNCIQIPNLSTSETIPQYQVSSFITKEQHGLVYLWQGDSISASDKPPTSFSLDAKSLAGEGHRLITLSHPSVIDTLLDSPSLLLKIDQVTLIDNHWMGEPTFDGRQLTVERVADWTRLAKKRQRIASDFPLILRIQLDIQTSVACIELLDEQNTPLVKTLFACQAVTPVVTAVFWRWIRPTINEKAYSKIAYSTYKKTSVAIAEQVDPSALLAVHPYISSVLHHKIKPASALDRARIEVSQS